MLTISYHFNIDDMLQLTIGWISTHCFDVVSLANTYALKSKKLLL